MSDLQQVTWVSESFCELNFISLVLSKTDCMVTMYYKYLNTYQPAHDILVTSIKTRCGCIKLDPCHVNSRWSTFEPNWTQIWDPVLSESYLAVTNVIYMIYISIFTTLYSCYIVHFICIMDTLLLTLIPGAIVHQLYIIFVWWVFSGIRIPRNTFSWAAEVNCLHLRCVN